MLQGTEHVPLHRAKLTVPQALFSLVPRQRLDAKLDASLAGRLTLVTAPAGFGKTTAVAQWLRRRRARYAWLSLDEGDNDPIRFWTYLIGALETLPHEIGGAARTMLRSPAPPWEAVISSLIDALDDVPFDFALVLDDFHVVDDPLVRDTFAFLMRYAPSCMHVVILSRSLVALPFSRLRLSGQLTELTATDLSFSRAEAKQFYEQRELHVTDDDVAKLLDLTGGWAAGMQMTAMSPVQGGERALLPDRIDVGCFNDYFMEEVFSRFDDATQCFLMQTSILERLCGPLCDAVTGEANGRRTLETIAAEGGFLICLDEVEGWYRYHQLFAEFLQGTLRKRHPERMGALHRRAAAWFEDHGSVTEAVGHDLGGGDLDRAIGLIKKQAAGMLGRGERATLLRWLDVLPPARVQRDAQLCLIQAMAGIAEGSVHRVTQWLERTETCMRSRGIDPAEQGATALGPDWAIAQLYLATRRQSIEDVLHWLAVLERTRNEDSQLTYGLIFEHQECSLLGGALGGFGRLKSKAQGMEGEVHLRLRELMPPSARRGFFPVANAEALYECNQIDLALKSLLVGIEEAQASGSAGALVPAYITLARVHMAHGDVTAALGAAAACERQVVALGQPQWLGAVAALRVRLRMAAGDGDAAAQWLEHCRVDVYDRLSAARAFEHMTLARVLLALGRGEEAAFLLERLLAKAQEEQSIPRAIEAANLLALGWSALGRAPQALEVLRTSLRLGRENGYLRTFVDEGPPMLSLLLRAQHAEGRHAQDEDIDYVHRLVALLRQGPVRPWQLTPLPALIEPLTAREIDVLRLVSLGLDNRSVAREIGVELQTVKTHLTSVYAKLGVTGRREAVERARLLGMLRP